MTPAAILDTIPRSVLHSSKDKKDARIIFAFLAQYFRLDLTLQISKDRWRDMSALDNRLMIKSYDGDLPTHALYYTYIPIAIFTPSDHWILNNTVYAAMIEYLRTMHNDTFAPLRTETDMTYDLPITVVDCPPR